MKIINCTKEYWPFVLYIRNKLRKGFFQQHIISKEEHEKFMRKWSDSYFVCISHDGETKLGWVGVVDNDIRIAVAPEFQKQGVGKFMLEYIKVAFPEATAKIFSKNIASIKSFQSVGIPLEIIE